MPTTGVDFDKIIDWKGGRNYTGYFSALQKNATIKEATILYSDLLFATNDKQRIEDELFGLKRTETLLIPVANQLYLYPQATPQPNTVADYNHLLDLFVFQVEPIKANVTAATATSPVKITLSRTTNLRTGDRIKISGVVGNIACNGVRYIEMLNQTQCTLFYDERLTLPVAGNFPYISGGTIERYVGTYAQNARQKTAAIAKPKLYFPKYEIANGYLKILPKSIVVHSVILDYISKPTTFIDVANSSIDLELTYSYRYITNLANEVNRLLGMDSRDLPLAMQSQAEIMQQP
jgi:hypothetical protein